MTDREYIEIHKKYPDPYDNSEWHTHYEGEEEDYKKVVEYNKALCEEFPFLIPSNRWSGIKITEAQNGGYWPGSPDDIPDYDYTYTELDDMPTGWRLAFGLDMCREIKEELIKFDYLDKYRITQIKEKYGSLRWYCGGAPIGKLSEDYEEVIIQGSDTLPEYDKNEFAFILDHTDNYESIFDENGKTKDNAREIMKNNEKATYHYRKHRIIEKCKIDEIISKYERLSYDICIDCGKPAKWVSTGWISPWCDDCKHKYNDDRYVPIEDYYGE